MVDTIGKVMPGHPIQKPQPIIPEKTQEKPVIPAPNRDVVTISDKGKQAVQLRTAGATPTEEMKETPIQKAVETTVGKK